MNTWYLYGFLVIMWFCFWGRVNYRRMFYDELFIYKYHLKKDSFLNFLFLRRFSQFYPRIASIAVALFFGFLSWITVLALAIVATIFDYYIIEQLCFYVSLTITIIISILWVSVLLFNSIKMEKTSAEINTMDSKELIKIKEEIRREWPEYE